MKLQVSWRRSANQDGVEFCLDSASDYDYDDQLGDGYEATDKACVESEVRWRGVANQDDVDFYQE